MRREQVTRLTYVAASGALASVVLTSIALVLPRQPSLVAAMTAGQALGILSLALYLLAVALDLDEGGALDVASDGRRQAVREDETRR